MNCTFQFYKNPDKVFYNGQLVSGTASLSVKTSDTIRGIEISVNGLTEVTWLPDSMRSRSDGPSYKKQLFYGVEKYMNYEKFLLGGMKDTVELTAGNHKFPFDFQIPQNVQTSFIGAYGYIKYEIILTIHRTPPQCNDTFSEPVTVIRTLNLNADSYFKNSIREQSEKEFCCGICCWLKRGPFIVYFSIPYSGYAPGQMIPFTINIKNDSSITCRKVKLRLIQNVLYTSQTEFETHIKENLKVAEKDIGKVKKSSKIEIKDSIQVPAIPPSSLSTSNLIDISYELQLKFYTPMCHMNFETVAPITIGTIPLIETSTNQNPIVINEPHCSNEANCSHATSESLEKSL